MSTARIPAFLRTQARLNAVFAGGVTGTPLRAAVVTILPWAPANRPVATLGVNAAGEATINATECDAVVIGTPIDHAFALPDPAVSHGTEATGAMGSARGCLRLVGGYRAFRRSDPGRRALLRVDGPRRGVCCL